MKSTMKNKRVTETFDLVIGKHYYDLDPNEFENATKFKVVGVSGDDVYMEIITNDNGQYIKNERLKTYCFSNCIGIPWYEVQYKNQVTVENFIDWYFSDMSTNNIVSSLLDALKGTGKVTFDINKIFADCQYIPQYICLVDGDEEYDPSDVELI